MVNIPWSPLEYSLIPMHTATIVEGAWSMGEEPYEVVSYLRISIHTKLEI